MSENSTRQQVKEITDRLETGKSELFTSDKYAEYLRTMSRFYRYSTRNTLLIHKQKPEASLVAGYQAWQSKFGRFVKKGEKVIKILAPTPYLMKQEKMKLDPDTKLPVLDENGVPVMETVERRLARFKVTSVFDLSQTDGKPLPTMAETLTGDFYTVGMIFGHSLKGGGLQLNISTNMEAMTAKYVDVRLERKQTVLDAYHNALHLKTKQKEPQKEASKATKKEAPKRLNFGASWRRVRDLNPRYP